MKRRASVSLQVLVTVLSMLTLGRGYISAAASETILHSFDPLALGFQPNGPLISDATGNLYGSTTWGGASGLGTVLKLTPNSQGGWKETVLYSFGASNVYAPNGALVFDAAGNLYGAASWGGSSGFGGVFKLTLNSRGVWTENVICGFDGYGPDGGLIFDAVGNLYGVEGFPGYGTVFELTPHSNGAWTKSLVYTFTGGSDGRYPNDSLVLDGAGHLYGTTSSGGTADAGLVFELTPALSGPWSETVLYSFSGGSDGDAPSGGVIFDQAGNLYGNTGGGGTSQGCYSNAPCGTVFTLTAGLDGFWTESVIYSFNGGTDGEDPGGALTFDQAGNLYGTTAYGGSGSWGTAFKLSPSSDGQWTESVLWNFAVGSDGREPETGVIIGQGGQLYGTAFSGGVFLTHGTVFELTHSEAGPWKETTISSLPYADAGLRQTS